MSLHPIASRNQRSTPMKLMHKEPAPAKAAANGHAWRKPPKPIYALSAYTVEKRGQKWYVIKTAEQNAGRNTWRGPYLTLDRATLAIAKLLSLEVIERHKRISDWYGDPA